MSKVITTHYDEDGKELIKEIRCAVLKELNGRGGFDDWYEQIDEEILDEIHETLDKEIQTVLDRWWSGK